jgi:hypothetical protein
MLSKEVQDELTKLISIVNDTADDMMNCRLIVINNDRNWKKSIKDSINKDYTLYPYRYYCITCERFVNGDCIKTELEGTVIIQIERMLKEMDKLCSMIITIRTSVNVYDKEKGRLDRPKFVYIVA